jgi:CheY-like chemotaxis protein
MEGRVLIAEDNDDCRTVIRMLLTHLGCTVLEASNGVEAIEKAESAHLDLILMDWMMPQLGGLEATKRLKANPKTKDIPVVICTAFGMEALGHRNLLYCHHEIIQKPLHLGKIAELVGKYIPQKGRERTVTPVRNTQHSVLEALRVVRKVQTDEELPPVRILDHLA